jgi:hypothetical protein
MSETSGDQLPALRRQLRFALFLQGFAAIMMGGAAAVRAFAFGWDAVTILLAAGFILILVATVFTWRKLQDLS